jgi:hypothetical protein
MPDPHEYVIREWREVDTEQFDSFVRLIKAKGYQGRYRAPYRPDYVMTNHYLVIDDWCYWFINPNMLNRERAEHQKHEPIQNLDGRPAHCRSARISVVRATPVGTIA